MLPLASQIVNENAPFVRSLLLHGAPKTGKTLLVHDTLLQKTEDIGKPSARGISKHFFLGIKIIENLIVQMVNFQTHDSVSSMPTLWHLEISYNYIIYYLYKMQGCRYHPKKLPSNLSPKFCSLSRQSEDSSNPEVS